MLTWRVFLQGDNVRHKTVTTLCPPVRPNQQRLPQHLHFVFESLQLLGRRLRHFEDLDRHVSVPLALEDRSKGTRTYPLLNGHFPRVDLPVVAGVSVTPSVLKQKGSESPRRSTTAAEKQRERKPYLRLSFYRRTRRVCAPCARRETWAVGAQESREKRVDWWRAWGMAPDLHQ